MAITDNKIITWTTPIVREADQPSRTASAMKAVFDGNSNQLKTALNALIDDLVGSGGSAEIGSAAIDDISAGTLLEQLTAIRTLIDGRVKSIGVGTVTTGAAGSSASVTVSGTMPDVVLNFTIPKGDDGNPLAAHASHHASDGDDVVTPAAIGAAAADHNHSGVYSPTNHNHDGTYAPVTSGTSILKGNGSGGFSNASGGTDYVVPPAAVSSTGSVTVTVEANKEYSYTAVTSLAMTGAAVSCHGFVTFAAETPTISVSGFTGSAGDDIADAAASEVWEFSCAGGYIVWKKWSA